MKGIYPLPKEGGCPKGRGLAEGERELSQPPALRATSFQRKEGENGFRASLPLYNCGEAATTIPHSYFSEP